MLQVIRNLLIEADQFTDQEREKFRLSKIRAFEKGRDYKLPDVDLTDPRQMKKVAMEMEVVYGILYQVDVGVKIGDKYSHAVFDAYREVYDAIEDGYEIVVRKQKHEEKDIIKEEPKLTAEGEKQFSKAYWNAIKKAKENRRKRKPHQFEPLSPVLEEGETVPDGKPDNEKDKEQHKKESVKPNEEENIDPNAKVSRLNLRSKLSSFMPTFSESRRMRNVPEVMQKIVDMGFHKDKESREERDEKIQQVKANYKRASKEMPKSYEAYKTLHTGYYVMDEPKEKLIETLSKVLAAERLQRTKKPFSEKSIKQMAKGMKAHLGLEKLTRWQLEDILTTTDNVKEFAAKRERAMYAVPKEQRIRYVDDMKLLWSSIDHTMKKDPKGVTTEFRVFAEEVHKASQLDPKTSKGSEFMLANIRIMNTSEYYMKGRKQVRTGSYRNERFNSTLDAQAMILHNTDSGRKLFDRAIMDRIRVTTDRINEVRGTEGLTIARYGRQRIQIKYGNALVSGNFDKKRVKSGSGKSKTGSSLAPATGMKK